MQEALLEPKAAAQSQQDGHSTSLHKSPDIFDLTISIACSDPPDIDPLQEMKEAVNILLELKYYDKERFLFDLKRSDAIAVDDCCQIMMGPSGYLSSIVNSWRKECKVGTRYKAKS